MPAVGLLGDQDVPRLHIPMDKAEVMCGVECFSDLADEVDGARRLESSLLLEQTAKVRAVDVRHRQVEGTVRFTRIDRADDVRVVEARRELGFTEKATAKPLVPRELGHEQ